MPAKEQPKKQPVPPPDPERTKEVRDAVQEYIDDQRAIIETIRRKMN